MFEQRGADLRRRSTLRIVIIGCGAVGGYFGGRLAASGAEVTFVARGVSLAALRSRSLQVESVNGDFHVRVGVTDKPEELAPADVVLVAVKSWQLAESVSAIRPLLGSRTVVVPLQNGVEAPATLASLLGQERVAGGLCRIIAFVDAPGRIRHVGAEPYIAFGPLADGQREQLERLEQEFVQAGVRCEIPPDIDVAIWEKFLFITPLSGVGAVTRCPVGVFRAAKASRAQLIGAMEEIVAVGGACGVVLAPDAIARTLNYIDSLPENGTSSMQRDIAAGRLSELEAQVGAVVRLGRANRVPTPVHDGIYAQLEPLERRAQEKLRTSS
jgi:2-dehydropantoate 2-reductase